MRGAKGSSIAKIFPEQLFKLRQMTKNNPSYVVYSALIFT